MKLSMCCRGRTTPLKDKLGNFFAVLKAKVILLVDGANLATSCQCIKGPSRDGTPHDGPNL